MAMYEWTMNYALRMNWAQWGTMPGSLSRCQFRIVGSTVEARWGASGEVYPPVVASEGARILITSGRPPTIRVATPPHDPLILAAWEARYYRAKRVRALDVLIRKMRNETYYDRSDVDRGFQYLIGADVWLDRLQGPRCAIAADRRGWWAGVYCPANVLYRVIRAANASATPAGPIRVCRAHEYLGPNRTGVHDDVVAEYRRATNLWPGVAGEWSKEFEAWYAGYPWRSLDLAFLAEQNRPR